MIEIRVVFLGPSRELAGVSETVLGVPFGCSVQAIRPLLAQAFPSLGEHLSYMRIAVNDAFVPVGHVLQPGDEVATIPPVSGGEGDERTMAKLVTGVIDELRIHDFVSGEVDLGGICTFSGATRAERSAEHGALMHLEYEAYEGMARKQLQRLAGEAVERFRAGKAAVVHRVGMVPVGERSVVIAVACPHRDKAFEACRWIIDTLKQDVPIWKQDVFEDGFVRWVDASKNAAFRSPNH